MNLFKLYLTKYAACSKDSLESEDVSALLESKLRKFEQKEKQAGGGDWKSVIKKETIKGILKGLKLGVPGATMPSSDMLESAVKSLSNPETAPDPVPLNPHPPSRAQAIVQAAKQQTAPPASS